ncbi:unnamed protein product [Ectocarpus sp. 12 AP-2014]
MRSTSTHKVRTHPVSFCCHDPRTLSPSLITHFRLPTFPSLAPTPLTFFLHPYSHSQPQSRNVLRTPFLHGHDRQARHARSHTALHHFWC